MPSKPVIIFTIDNLGKGGAEILLVGLLQDLQQQFDVVLVTLTGECAFEENNFANIVRYSLNVKNRLSYLNAIYRLRLIIKKHRPVLIHSHLVYSTLITRLACPPGIPLLFSVHNEIGKYEFEKSFMLSFLEKITVKNNQILIAVSHTVLRDYESKISFKGKKYVLENYIGDDFFKSHLLHKPFKKGDTLKIVALGNVKLSKNYEYLVRSFLNLKNYPVSLDIYGGTDKKIFPELLSFIETHNLPVIFKGVAKDIPELFSGYHLYVMTSSHEGFGIAAIEAMACKLPLLLSDLPVLREVTHSIAIFFDLKQPDAASARIKEILEGRHDIETLAAKGINLAKNYNKQHYLKKLIEIYGQVVQDIE